MLGKPHFYYNLDRQQHILITGGAGYLGSYFVEQLSAWLNTQVTILSRDELKQFDLKIKLGEHASHVQLIGDVRDAGRLKEAFKDVGVKDVSVSLQEYTSGLVERCEPDKIALV